RNPSRLCSRRAIPVHVTIHSISSQRGVNHNMLVLLNNFRIRFKEFKRIAMRACKTDQSFCAMIYLAAAVINSR
ncbi:hypothetical protein, partial [Novosphingobium sp. FKTRR1]|uniref:hypothetical protein n=1 Tax=Novosphingobium sp. FKTRR1 TaxID=2879118 RepID=UPI00351CC619